MIYTVIIAIALGVFVLALVLIFFVQGRSSKPKNLFPSPEASKETVASMLANGTPQDHIPSLEHDSQLWFSSALGSGSVTNDKVIRTPGDARITGSTLEALPMQNKRQNAPDFAAFSHPQQELSSPALFSAFAPSTLAHAQGRYELEQEYERGMRTLYDEKVGAVNFIGMHVVMNTPAEVEIAFHVCKRQIRAVLRSRGLERAPTLTDIGGLVIGREATAAWGQALKNYLEEMCIKVGKDTYLLAHYNSQANRPDQDQLQEKIRRIQFMTSAAINNFQSNIFDTREEAVAFLLRMREVYRV